MNDLEKRLLDDFQRDFPLVSRPFAALAERLGASEAEVISGLRGLCEKGVISRVGAVFRPHVVGASTLAAMAVPAERLDEVADLVSSYFEVNHNYEREHRLNLWFVIVAPSAERVAEVLGEIAGRSGLTVLDLPMEAEYRIDLGFGLQWH